MALFTYASGIRKLGRKRYSIIRHYNLYNICNNYHSDILNDKTIYKMVVLVNLTITAKFGRITNSGVQLQFHIIGYLAASDRWVNLKNEKK